MLKKNIKLNNYNFLVYFFVNNFNGFLILIVCSTKGAT